MSPVFKRVPATDGCFAISELLAQSKGPMGISDISGKLDLNKNTAFNIGPILIDLNVLENQHDKVPDSSIRELTKLRKGISEEISHRLESGIQQIRTTRTAERETVVKKRFYC